MLHLYFSVYRVVRVCSVYGVRVYIGTTGAIMRSVRDYPGVCLYRRVESSDSTGNDRELETMRRVCLESISLYL